MGWSVVEYARHERGLMVPSPWLPLWAQVPGCPADFFQKGLIARPWPDPCKLPQASAAAVPSLRSTGASCPQSPASCHCPATAARAPHSRHRRGAGCPLIHHPERPPVRPALSSLGLAAVVVSARPCPCLCPYPYPSCACSSSWWSCLPPGGHGAVKGRAKRPSSLHLHPPPRVPEYLFVLLLPSPLLILGRGMALLICTEEAVSGLCSALDLHDPRDSGPSTHATFLTALLATRCLQPQPKEIRAVLQPESGGLGWGLGQATAFTVFLIRHIRRVLSHWKLTLEE